VIDWLSKQNYTKYLETVKQILLIIQSLPIFTTLKTIENDKNLRQFLLWDVWGWWGWKFAFWEWVYAAKQGDELT